MVGIVYLESRSRKGKSSNDVLMISNRNLLSSIQYREKTTTYAPHLYIRHVLVETFIRLSSHLSHFPLFIHSYQPVCTHQSSSPQPLKSKRVVLCDLYDRQRSSVTAVESYAESHQKHDLSHRDRTDFCCTSHGQSAPGPFLRLCVWVKYGPMIWEEFVTALQPIEIML
jgi:hypothetical protein